MIERVRACQCVTSAIACTVLACPIANAQVDAVLSPLEIASEPTEPEAPTTEPEESIDHADTLIAMGVAPLGVLAFGADAGDYRSHFVGVSLLPLTGRILHAPEEDALLVHLRWQFDLLELPLAAYRILLDSGVGQRLKLGRGHELYASAGMHGVGGMALKWFRAEFRFPNATAGYLWHHEDDVVHIGPEAGLAMIGAFNVGNAAQISLRDGNQKDYHGVMYTFRPVAGPRGSAVVARRARRVPQPRLPRGGRRWGHARRKRVCALWGVVGEGLVPPGGGV